MHLSALLASSHQISHAAAAPGAHMASPQHPPKAPYCWVGQSWCVCGVGTCVLLWVCNCNTRTKPKPYFACMEKRCFTEESISWKPFSFHYGVGRTVCAAGLSEKRLVALCHHISAFRLEFDAVICEEPTEFIHPHVRWLYHFCNASCI